MPLMILIAAVAAFKAMKGEDSIVPAREPAEQVWVVQARELSYGDVRPTLELYGRIIAGSELELRVPVGGRVEMVSSGFREGAIVHQGDLLLAIDEFDYRNVVSEQEAALKEARARLDEYRQEVRAERKLLDNAGLEINLREQDRMRNQDLSKQGVAARKALDDSSLALIQAEQAALKHQQTIARSSARIKQQEATIEQLEIALNGAQRELQRTILRAPLDGFVVDVHAAVGSWLMSGENVGRIIDARRLEVRFRLAESDYARLMNAALNGFGELIGRKIGVIWRRGAELRTFEAEVERTGAQIEPGSGGIPIYARLLDSGPQIPLRPGAFVEVTLPDRLFTQVARLPANALIGGENLFLVDQNRVSLHPVKVIHRNGDKVLIRGSMPSDQLVVVSPPAELGPGAKVEVR